jgi:DNA-binding NtrC family response regulator
MKTVRSVLLVHNEPDAFRGLEEMLHEQEIRTAQAHQCAEARSLLKETRPVDLVLTDVTLADGTWKDIIRMVRKSAKNTPVIVMSRVVSMKLYLDTQDAGAADFIVPPMAPRDLAYILTTAMDRRVAPVFTRERRRPRGDQRIPATAH